MKGSQVSKRIAAFILDIILIGIFTSIITVWIPESTKYKEAKNNIDNLLEKYVKNNSNDSNTIDELYENKYVVEKESIPETLIYTVIFIGYFVGFAFYNKGQTIGKKLTHIKIVNENNQEVSYIQLFGRTMIFTGCLFTIISTVVIFFIKPNQYSYTIGIMDYVKSFIVIASFIMILCRKDKRGLHDLLCRTKVIEC